METVTIVHNRLFVLNSLIYWRSAVLNQQQPTILLEVSYNDIDPARQYVKQGEEVIQESSERLGFF